LSTATEAIKHCEQQTHRDVSTTENSMPTPLTKASPVQQAEQQILIASSNTNVLHQQGHLQQADIPLKAKEK
jgi:hypothetical protein